MAPSLSVVFLVWGAKWSEERHGVHFPKIVSTFPFGRISHLCISESAFTMLQGQILPISLSVFLCSHRNIYFVIQQAHFWVKESHNLVRQQTSNAPVWANQDKWSSRDGWRKRLMTSEAIHIDADIPFAVPSFFLCVGNYKVKHMFLALEGLNWYASTTRLV